MEEVYEQFKNNKYFTYHFNKEKPLPEKVDIKNLVFYFMTFLRHFQTDNKYFYTITHFVCIPDKLPKIKNMTEFIDFIVYIKYKMKSEEILLKKENIEKMTLKQLKNKCHFTKIKKYSKLNKKDIKDLINT